MTDVAEQALRALREPFPDHQVSLLPKQVRRDDQDKGRCDNPRGKYTADGQVCGGWHAKSVHLSYVGHAAITDRFLSVDPNWSWEPVAFGPDGLPAFDREGGLWIRLTIAGVSRLGYGDAQGKKGPNAVKEAIGDALRNAGMRFGAALDLWHKGDLHAAEVDRGNVDPDPVPREDPRKAVKARIWAQARQLGWDADELAADFATWSQGDPLTDADMDTLVRYWKQMAAS